MKSHPTPMGVFSIIQKHKMHHSNIYSGAPMPFMQRITWSGVAMHAGALPGYPASHGCIRLPMAFAAKMWNWTKMGARVIVTPGEMTPANFSHPLLVAQKVVPQPVDRRRAEGGRAGGEIRQGRGRWLDNQARAFRSESGIAIDRRSRQPRSDAVARTNPHCGCQRSHAGDQCRGHDVRCFVLREQAAGVASRCRPKRSLAQVQTVGSCNGRGQNRPRPSDSAKAEDKVAEAKSKAKPEEAKPEAAKSEVAELRPNRPT